MLIRVILKRYSTGTKIEYCEIVSRELVQFYGCQVALSMRSSELAKKLSGVWSIDVHQIAEHEYRKWVSDFVNVEEAIGGAR